MIGTGILGNAYRPRRVGPDQHGTQGGDRCRRGEAEAPGLSGFIEQDFLIKVDHGQVRVRIQHGCGIQPTPALFGIEGMTQSFIVRAEVPGQVVRHGQKSGFDHCRAGISPVGKAVFLIKQGNRPGHLGGGHACANV